MNSQEELMRLMKLSGLEDVSRSNNKLKEMYSNLDEEELDEGLLAKKFGDLRAKGSMDGQYAYNMTITSKATGGSYTLSIEPYGASASRDSSLTETFVNLSVRNTPHGEDNPDDLADAVTYGLDEFMRSGFMKKAGKFKKLTVQGFNEPYMAKAKQAAEQVANSITEEEQLDEIQIMGFGKGKKTGNFWVKTLNFNKYQFDASITSELTGGVYKIDFEPYGESSARGADATTIFLRGEVATQPEGNEDIKGLTSIIVNSFKKWEAKAKINHIEVQGFDAPELQSAKQQLTQLTQKYSR